MKEKIILALITTVFSAIGAGIGAFVFHILNKRLALHQSKINLQAKAHEQSFPVLQTIHEKLTERYKVYEAYCHKNETLKAFPEFVSPEYVSILKNSEECPKHESLRRKSEKLENDFLDYFHKHTILLPADIERKIKRYSNNMEKCTIVYEVIGATFHENQTTSINEMWNAVKEKWQVMDADLISEKNSLEKIIKSYLRSE